MTQIRSNPQGFTGQAKPFSFLERLREIDIFFDGTSEVHQTMRRVVAKLADANIPYAIVGGMALNAHNYRRTTDDMDFLLTTEGFAAFVRLYGDSDFDRVHGWGRRFRDRPNGVTFDILLTISLG
jgi:hypothetical protein